MTEYLRQQNKLKIQSDQFPVLCSRCLGPNKNLKMFRSIMGSECKMCHRVYTEYKWRRQGSTLLQTNICSVCSQLRNLCQCCLLDLEFHLPGFVRDSFNAREGFDETTTEMSEQSSLYYSEQAEKMLTDGSNKHLVSHQQASTTDAIIKMAKKNPYDTRGISSTTGDFLKPPVDKSVKTIYVGGLKLTGVGKITEKELNENFAPYGLLKEVKIVPNKKCGLITFVNRDDAEICAEALYNRLVIKNIPLKILWAKPKKKKKKKKKKQIVRSFAKVPDKFKLNVNENPDIKLPDVPLPKGLDFILPPSLFDIPIPPSDDDNYVYRTTLNISK